MRLQVGDFSHFQAENRQPLFRKNALEGFAI
jgi:hypothetical protein